MTERRVRGRHRSRSPDDDEPPPGEEAWPAPASGDDDESFEEGPQRPSRSEKKRAAEAVFELGRTLVELPEQKLRHIPLPDDVAEAILEARRIRSHGAKKRQLQFVAKLLLQADLDAIIEANEQLRDRDRRGTAEFQRLERWRTRLLDEGEAALDELVESHPGADRARFAALVRAAQEEAERGQPPAAFRALFRELRDLAGEAPRE